MGYKKISDYAVIGNCRTAALVARDGSIDWWCLPRFDGEWVFGALLDRFRGGSFRVGPVEEDARVVRRYLRRTNVLETVFHTSSGTLRLVDFMPVASRDAADVEPRPEHQILRMVECTRGEVEVEAFYWPRPDASRVQPSIEDHGRLGFWCDHDAGFVCLDAEVPLELGSEGARVEGRFVLSEGEDRFLSVSFDRNEVGIIPPLGRLARERLDETVGWWRAWSDHFDYEGPYREEVLRSALTLKLMAYAPSGAIIAAVTTSLPEVVGGSRNWDYRYCWLRDASWTLRALFDLGFRKEADAFFDWLIHSTRLSEPDIHALYDVHGIFRITEEELPHLEGYRGSRPVRVGNGAADQFQLDVYGEVIGAAYELVARGGELDPDEARRILDLGKIICERWEEPDEGIWELRSGRRHHTYSKAMCWIALDRLIHFPDADGLEIPREHFEEVKERIRETVDREGWDEEVGSFVASFGDRRPDASLLRLLTTNYVNADSDRGRGTFSWIMEELEENCLVYRYRKGHDELGGEEGAFGLCGFWAVEVLALQGRLDEARERMDHLLGYANDVGIFSEEVDPATGEALGNVPQSFTHLGMIIAALRIGEATEGSGYDPTEGLLAEEMAAEGAGLVGTGGEKEEQ